MRPNAAIACGLSLVLLFGGAAGASSLELITRTETDITQTDIRTFSLNESFQSGQFTLSDGQSMTSRPSEGWGRQWGGAFGMIPFSEPVDYHFGINLYFVPPGTSTASMSYGFPDPPYANAPEIDISGELKGYLGSDGTIDIGLNAKPTNVQFSVSNSAKAELPPSLIAAFTDPSRVQVSEYLLSWDNPTGQANGIFVTLAIGPPPPGDPHAVPEPSSCVAFAGLALGLLVRGRWLGAARR